MTHPRGGAARGQAHHTTLQPLGQPEARNQLFKESPTHDPRSSNALHFVNVWTKEHLGGLQLNSLNKTTHMNETSRTEREANNKRECPEHRPRPGSVTVVMAHNLTLGHCPTPASHHAGFWGHVLYSLYSLAWKRDHIPSKTGKALSRACRVPLHYHLVGTKHFFSPE